MKKLSNPWTIRLASVALAGICLCGGVALAAGDRDDPLITLSYLNQTAGPDILEQVEDSAQKRQDELLSQLNASIDSYKQALDEANSQQPSGSATYTVVTLSKDQKLNLGVGCEIMLRVGTATVSSNTAPALIDVSTGGTLGSGGALVTNHLYVATIPDRVLNATSNTVKVLARGSYTIS